MKDVWQPGAELLNEMLWMVFCIRGHNKNDCQTNVHDNKPKTQLTGTDGQSTGEELAHKHTHTHGKEIGKLHDT